MKLHVVTIIAVLAAVVVFVAAKSVAVLRIQPFYGNQQERMVHRVLKTDPRQLLDAGRELLGRHPGFKGSIPPTSPEIPAAIRRLKPTWVMFDGKSVSVNFSDSFNPFGIMILAPDAPIKGGKPWIDGVRLFDDGQLRRIDWKNIVSTSGMEGGWSPDLRVHP